MGLIGWGVYTGSYGNLLSPPVLIGDV
jgi:hypothetical protein